MSLDNARKTQPHVVIIGGGFGGLNAARALARASVRVTLIDLLPIEPTCVNGQPIPEELREIFWEGACVVAAHQYLKFQGEPGFVDEQGRPNPNYDTGEARIAAFRQLGAAVIRQYQDMD